MADSEPGHSTPPPRMRMRMYLFQLLVNNGQPAPLRLLCCSSSLLLAAARLTPQTRPRQIFLHAPRQSRCRQPALGEGASDDPRERPRERQECDTPCARPGCVLVSCVGAGVGGIDGARCGRCPAQRCNSRRGLSRGLACPARSCGRKRLVIKGEARPSAAQGRAWRLTLPPALPALCCPGWRHPPPPAPRLCVQLCQGLDLYCSQLPQRVQPSGQVPGACRPAAPRAPPGLSPGLPPTSRGGPGCLEPGTPGPLPGSPRCPPPPPPPRHRVRVDAWHLVPGAAGAARREQPSVHAGRVLPIVRV
jgi:hypothetical protein